MVFARLEMRMYGERRRGRLRGTEPTPANIIQSAISTKFQTNSKEEGKYEQFLTVFSLLFLRNVSVQMPNVQLISKDANCLRKQKIIFNLVSLSDSLQALASVSRKKHPFHLLEQRVMVCTELCWSSPAILYARVCRIVILCQ